MKRFIFALVATMTLLFFAGKSYADQPPQVPWLHGVVFWIEVACQPSDMSITELRAWCEDQVADVNDLWGTPPILTICPPGEPNSNGPNRIVPNGAYCHGAFDGVICAADEVKVNCSVRLVPD